jgi:engulfment/cell motility protein 1
MPLKLALFNLQRYIGEDEFADEFVLRGGVKTIVRLVEKNEKGLAGNTLAVCGLMPVCLKLRMV